MNFYTEKFRRNTFTKKEQEKIRKTMFTIIGLGGTGGFVFENLLRMGAENFTIYDSDNFELTNFNRQVLATSEFLDKPKIMAARTRAKKINKNAKIIAKKEFNEKTKLSSSIVIDTTDNVASKLTISRAAYQKKLPYIFCSAQSTRGIVSVFTNYKFEKAFQIKNFDPKKYAKCSSILCPAASLAGTLAALYAVNLVLKRPVTFAPEAIFFDISKKEIFWKGKLG